MIFVDFIRLPDTVNKPYANGRLFAQVFATCSSLPADQYQVYG